MPKQQKHSNTQRPWWKKILFFLPGEDVPSAQKRADKKLAARIRPEDYQTLYKRLGYHFRDYRLLRQSLTHRSFMNEAADPAIEDNEKLEFLGDSVLGLVISDFLYRNYPRFTEGDYSRIKSHVVSEPFLAEIAKKKLDLGSFILLGKGEAASGGHEKNSLLSDCYEAVVAAIYLDGGMRAAREFLLLCFQDRIETLVQEQHILDHKSLFQEHAQERFSCIPRYKLRRILGPEHDKTFEIEIRIKKEVFTTGTGKSKKEAEQAAAKAALEKLNISRGRIK